MRWGTRPDQAELVGTLETIVSQVADTGFEAPAIAVIGSVVKLRTQLENCKPRVFPLIPDELSPNETV